MDPDKLRRFREVAIKAGYKSADIDKFLTKKQEEMATVNLVKQGQIPFNTLAQSNPVLANKLLQQGFVPQGETDPEEIAADLKAQQDIEAIESGTYGQTESEKEIKRKESEAKVVIDQLFDIYYGKEGEKPLSLTEAGKYRLPAQLKSLGTKIKAGKANSVEKRIYEYNRILESKRSKLAKAAGDAGNLALQEQILAGRGLPDPASTFGESLTLFDSAYGAFAGGNRPKKLEDYLQSQESTSEKQPLSQGQLPIQPPQEETGISKYLTSRNIGLGAATAASLAPPVGPLAFLKGAGMVGRSALAGGILGATQGEDQSLGQRAVGATTGALGGAALGAILRPLQTAQKLGGIAKAGAKGIKIDPKPLVKAGKQYVQDVPLAKSTLDKLLPSIKKAKDIPSLLQKLDRWGKLTYTKGGDPKSTAAANLMNTLYAAGRQQLAEKAPLVGGARTVAGKVRNVQKLGKGVLKTGANIAPWFVGGYLFNKLLGRE